MDLWSLHLRRRTGSSRLPATTDGSALYTVERRAPLRRGHPRDSLHSDDNGTIDRVPAHIKHLTSIMSSIRTSPTRQAAVTDCFTDGARRLEG